MAHGSSPESKWGLRAKPEEMDFLQEAQGPGEQTMWPDLSTESSLSIVSDLGQGSKSED